MGTWPFKIQAVQMKIFQVSTWSFFWIYQSLSSRLSLFKKIQTVLPLSGSSGLFRKEIKFFLPYAFLPCWLGARPKSLTISRAGHTSFSHSQGCPADGVQCVSVSDCGVSEFFFTSLQSYFSREKWSRALHLSLAERCGTERLTDFCSRDISLSLTSPPYESKLTLPEVNFVVHYYVFKMTVI